MCENIITLHYSNFNCCYKLHTSVVTFVVFNHNQFCKIVNNRFCIPGKMIPVSVSHVHSTKEERQIIAADACRRDNYLVFWSICLQEQTFISPLIKQTANRETRCDPFEDLLMFWCFSCWHLPDGLNFTIGEIDGMLWSMNGDRCSKQKHGDCCDLCFKMLKKIMP